ncbi:hypothetical protein GBA65_07735 [Rubrobacter marinus]|uniref:Uncharacterized protein n=1 Tax=Rubrobacter marinus TaxID=2653852 RepID=A0A6G8PW69_9ACTN|nr:DUF4352 domain-containing protein [Rubrobacter marinus]QIN78433.1 hypothetical protein GBA65_07735 [Rubrobacter marinus]
MDAEATKSPVAAAARESDAGLAPLSPSPEDFRVSGESVEETGPIRHRLDAKEVPPGSAATGTLVFQVSEGKEDLRLSFGGARPVALEEAPAGRGAEKPAGDGHGHQ